MARVLLLEDEMVLRSSMARGLRKVPGIEVDEAGSMEEALRAVDAAPPGLVISDIDLPDRSGIEILGELGRRRLKVPVVFITAYLKAYGSQIPRHADVDVREKPVSIDELRRIVLARLDTGEARSSPFSAVDYIQLACMGRHSVEILLRRGDETAGMIQIVGGELWSAQDPQGAGTAAFHRLVGVGDVAVECRTLRETPRERTLQAGWEELLLESAQLQDEAGRAAPAPSPEEFDAVWDEAVSALLAKDLQRAYALFLEAQRIRPDDRKVEANLARLREMGVGGT